MRIPSRAHATQRREEVDDAAEGRQPRRSARREDRPPELAPHQQDGSARGAALGLCESHSFGPCQSHRRPRRAPHATSGGARASAPCAAGVRPSRSGRPRGAGQDQQRRDDEHQQQVLQHVRAEQVPVGQLRRRDQREQRGRDGREKCRARDAEPDRRAEASSAAPSVTSSGIQQATRVSRMVMRATLR